MHPVSEKDGVQSAIQPSYTDPCHKEEHPPVHTQPIDCTQSSNITTISHSRVHREAPGLVEGCLPRDKAHLHNGMPSKLRAGVFCQRRQQKPGGLQSLSRGLGRWGGRSSTRGTFTQLATHQKIKKKKKSNCDPSPLQNSSGVQSAMNLLCESCCSSLREIFFFFFFAYTGFSVLRVFY